MTDLEQYYIDRLIFEYDKLEEFENLVAKQEQIVTSIEREITNIFGEQKAEEMYDKYKEWEEKMKSEV